MSLRVYNRKRKFNQTPEPRGRATKGKGPLKFVVQLHEATRLHYDFRLEFGGSYKSWAVPKGPSLNPQDQRLAVFVEDHPLEYGNFEGIIPGGNYGAGTVMIWDRGVYVERGSKERKDSEAAMKKGLEKGHITFVLDGEKLKGEFALIKLKKDASDKAWLLVKKRDDHSTYKRGAVGDAISVKTGRTMAQIAKEAEKAGDVWLSKRKSGKTTAAAKAPPAKPAPARASTAKSTPMPRRIKPMLATLSRTSVTGPDWAYEVSPEGLRALSEVEGKRVHVYSKSGLPFDAKFPEVVEALKTQTQPMLLDGEIVKSRAGRSVYHVYDLLYLGLRDLRHEPLKVRQQELQKALKENPHLKLVPLTKAPPKKGIVVAKKLTSIYESGTSNDWLQLPEHQSPGKAAAADALEGPRLTHLEKVYFPADDITKGDLLEYYRKIAPYILPHLIDRPQSLNRNPNGIAEKGFYQKDLTGHSPRWLKTKRIFSESADKSVNYVLCQDERSLLYIVNMGCIEINPWFSRTSDLDKPDYMIIDLDPDDNNPFAHVVEIAQEFHEILEDIGATNVCKTSGATGIHIGVPLGARYDFDRVRAFAHEIVRVVAKRHPTTTSLERSPSRRRGKIYLDYMQNRRGQTLAAPFCVRPRPGAPVSMPLPWKDLTARLKPEQFHIQNALSRVEKFGDFWKPVLGPGIDLEKCARSLKKKYGGD